MNESDETTATTQTVSSSQSNGKKCCLGFGQQAGKVFLLIDLT